MTPLPVAGERKRHRRGGRRLLLLPLAVFAAVACAACAYIGYVLWPRWPGPPVGPDAPALPVTVAGVAFNLPPAAIRVPVQRRPGAQERVDLAFLWPSLAPAERMRNVYPRYTAAEATPGPGGLTVLPFRAGTPYQGEDLIYDAATPTFLARCSRNGAGPTPGICLYERRIEGADLTLRFPRDWLDDWRLVAGNIDRLIARLRPSR
jgi:hypothetical protein